MGYYGAKVCVGGMVPRSGFVVGCKMWTAPYLSLTNLVVYAFARHIGLHYNIHHPESCRKANVREIKSIYMEAIAYKFVAWDVPALDTLKESRAYRLRSLLNHGIKLNREQKNWITQAVNSNSYFKSSVPVMGWAFNFSDVLRRFFVKQYGHIQEYYATDKTALREYLCGSIEEIVELPN